MLPANYNAIKANPILRTYNILFFLWLFLLIFFLLFIGATLVLSIMIFPSGNSFSQFMTVSSLYITPFLCYIFSFISTIWQRGYWKRIEQRRLAAARGDRSLLAVEQPVANYMALQLPCTIKLRLGKGSIPILVGITLVFALLLTSFPTLFNTHLLIFSPNRLYNFLAFFAITASVMIIILLAIFFSPTGTQKIVVTEQYLNVRAGGQNNTMRWEEARLFVMYNTIGAQKSGASITYELSSAQNIVRWNWVLHPNSLHIRMMPTIPLDEYNRLMQALNAFIVARTGLPLADLRMEPA